MSDAPQRYVSTGQFPHDAAADLVREAHRRFHDVDDGELSKVYPALERADPSRFGVCAVSVAGHVAEVGDCDVEFPLMSVAKPFTFALVCDTIGAAGAHRRLGANATGLPFNSLDAITAEHGGRTNPMVNPGAIATASLVPGATAAERWETLRSTLSRFAGRELRLDEETYESASATNLRNREIVAKLDELGALYADPVETLDLYTRQSCLAVTARDLATMGATLADGGVNPVTEDHVVEATTCRFTLIVMATAGLYETSGDWLYEVGLPGKSGIGGGIVTVSPGKGGLGTYSPLLDEAGNSVRGQLAAAYLSAHLGLDVFASEPAAS
jgi:glutaminase